MSRRWVTPLVVVAVGLAIFAFSLAQGHGLELVWLPAVLLAAAWPRNLQQRVRKCSARFAGRSKGQSRKRSR